MKDKHIFKVDTFSLKKTLECGQCFRFIAEANGGYCGIVSDKHVEVSQLGSTITVTGSISRELLSDFFTFDIDYERIEQEISNNEIFKKILLYSSGIHILRQPLFETIITFILSQNNNIKRITSLVSSLCSNFGNEISKGFFTFPNAKTIASLNLDELSVIRCGFRDKYIMDAASKWVSGDISEEIIRKAPLEEARAELMKIKGVGPKVANCVLLFGASRFNAFPEDVWIKRIMGTLFEKGLPDYVDDYAGIVQQYLFYYARAELLKTLK